MHPEGTKSIDVGSIIWLNTSSGEHCGEVKTIDSAGVVLHTQTGMFKSDIRFPHELIHAWAPIEQGVLDDIRALQEYRARKFHERAERAKEGLDPDVDPNIMMTKNGPVRVVRRNN